MEGIKERRFEVEKKSGGSLEKVGESVSLWRVDNTHHMPINRSSSHPGSPACASCLGRTPTEVIESGQENGEGKDWGRGVHPPINFEGRRTSVWGRGVESADSARPLAAPGVAHCGSVPHPATHRAL